MKLLTAIILALTGTLLPAASTYAHHSQAAFDATKVMTFEGKVNRLDWKNPHMYLLVDTKDENGKPLVLQIEGLAVTQAAVDGLNKDDLKAGTPMKVRVNPNREGLGKIARGLDVTLTDGRVLPFYNRPPGDLNLVPAMSIAGKWAPSLAETSKMFGAVGRWKYKAPRLTELPGSCTVEPVPFLVVINELRAIEVSAKTVVFHHNNSGDEAIRNVHLDQKQHPAGLKPSLHGHSIGHWEGGTLVVDTVGYTPDMSGIFTGAASGAKKHTIERLTLTDDRLRLRYEITIEDTDNLLEPATLSMLWDHRPDLDFTTEPCDQEVSARYIEK